MGRVDIYPTAALQGPPSAQLGYAEVTANQTGIVGSTVDLTGLAITITVPTGRRIKISGHILGRSTVASDVFQLGIQEGGTLINAAKNAFPTTDDLSVDVYAVITPSAGTHTYKLTALRSTGSGSLNIAAGANFPSYILIEDITGTFWNGVPVTNPPTCRVFHNAAVSISNNTDTVVLFNSERWDTDTMHSTSSLTSRVTINTAGVYDMTFSGEFVSAADYTGIYSYFRLNGATPIGIGSTGSTSFSGPGVQTGAASQWKFAVGDYVEVLVHQTNSAAAARNLNSAGNYSPEFSVTWIALG